MNALTASLIVVGIGALPAKPVEVPPGSSPLWPGLPESAKQYRVFGWVLVVLLYLAGAFCLLQGVNALRIVHHWEEWQAIFGSVLTRKRKSRSIPVSGSRWRSCFV